MLYAILATLFPPQCAVCNAVGSGLCDRCAPEGAARVTARLPTLRLAALGLKAVPNGGLWHRALPARFRNVVNNPERVTLLVSRKVEDATSEEMIIPKPGIPVSDFIL